MRKQKSILDLRGWPAGAAAWFGQRVDLAPLAAVAAKKTIPVHRATWTYALGGAAMFLLALQVGTGALLMLYYQPTEAAAHESIVRIMNEIPFGWLLRSLHAWGANLFIVVIGGHFLTTLFARAYRKPRELTWLSGMGMLFLALGFGFSGYLLPWNDLSYNATLVGTQIPGTVPVVGEFVVHLLRGGDQVTGATITRFFAAHVMLLPLCLGAFLLVHLALIQGQGMGLPLGMKDEEVRDRRPFFSEFLLIESGIWLVMFGGLVTLAVLLPAEVGVKADPLKSTPQGIKPEWYFLFMFQTLKHVPKAVGVALFFVLAAFVVLLPFLDRAAMHQRKSRWLTAVVVALLAYAAVFQTVAVLAPGVSHPPEEIASDSYSRSGGLVSLIFLWLVIGFLVYYLGKLAKLNTRVRMLYQDGNKPCENASQRHD